MKPSEIARAIEVCEEAEEELSDSERQFIDDARRSWAEDQFLTARQQEWLMQIYERVRP
jgi:hypothetical protein